MHIGKLIRKEVNNQGKTVVWLANQLSCSRTNVYKIYGRPYIDTSVLLRISLVLNYDFFALYSEKIDRQKKLLSLIDLHVNRTDTKKD